jgi:glycosyltransferase involved in cell wall biosynthesis
MRILYVSQGSELGGAERSLLDLMAAVAGALPDARLGLLAGSPGPLAEISRARGVEVTHVGLSSALGNLGDSHLKGRHTARRAAWLLVRGPVAAAAGVRQVATLARALAGLAPDLIHTNDGKSHALVSLAAPRGVPVIWHLRDFMGSRPVLRHVLRWLPRRPAACAAISEAVGRDASGSLGCRRVRVLLNAVDVEHFAPGPPDAGWLDAVAGIRTAPGTVRVGLVSTYARWKGHMVFLEAAARLLREPRPVPLAFYIIGGPIYRTAGSQISDAELREKMETLGIPRGVGLAGFQQDTPAVYRALDIVVHASTEPEPFGRTIAEAMACGRALIAAPVGGAAELFTDGLDGVGVPAGRAAELAHAIHMLAGDPDRRDLLGRNARRTALERFTRDRLGRQAAALYEEVRPRGRPGSGEART